MNYFIKTWLCPIQFLTVLVSVVVVSSLPVTDLKTITDQIKSDSCFSPSINILKKNNLSEFCDIHESEFGDTREVLCQGLLDLHTTFCKELGSISSFNNMEFAEIKETDSVDEFCKQWRNQARMKETSELFSHDSFKQITESCNITCLTLGKKKLNIMCPLLLGGSRSLLTGGADLKSPEKDTPTLMEPDLNQNPQMLGPSLGMESAVGIPEMNPDDSPSEVTSAKVETSKNAQPPEAGNVNKMVKLDEEMRENSKSTALNPVTVSKLVENKEISNANGNADSNDKKSESLPAQPAISPPAQSSSSQNAPMSDSGNQNNVQPLEKQVKGEEKMDGLIEENEGESKANLENPEENNDKPELIDSNQPVKPAKTVISLDESNPNAPKMNNDVQDENYDAEQDIINDQNLVAEQQSSRQEFSPQRDVWVEADDPHFFQYFMIISAAFILGYVILVNKKKLIALVVEGRRDGGRRRHHSASYSKLDSNLEEAMSSNRTTVSSHQVLY